MNVFVIPSWYPSVDHPLNGIFIKEQVQALAWLYPDHYFGISLWGQQDEALLLWAAEPVKSLKKWIKGRSSQNSRRMLRENLCEYKTPVFSWSRRFLKGNMPEIVAANLANFKQFEQEHGKVQLIHAHVAYPAGWIAMRLAEQLGIPYVITEHQGPFPLPSFQTKGGELLPLLHQPLLKADGLIAVGEALQRHIAGLLNRTVAYIPNMVDENLFSPSAKQEKEGFVFFSLGRITKLKGFDVLLQAIASQKEFFRAQHVVFRLGGTGEEQAAFQRLAQQLAIQDMLEWLGPLSRNQVADAFRACDAFVLPSRHESFGMVYAEALACGKPVIATACGGPESILTDEIAYFVTIGDVKELATAMIRMVQEGVPCHQEQIRTYFMQYFSRRVVSRQIVEMYHQILADA